jgi:hypothetical protein
VAVTAPCPSCGAPVVFKSAASIFAVCEYCQSTLVRHDQALEDIGKMAALVEDRSPLQLGAEGSYKGVHFALIGRIQIKYSQGVWNEWHLMFDDMRTGWLSEAGGEYVLTFAQYVQDALPKFEDLKIGQRFVLASQAWTVSNIEEAECIAGQGELPFKVGGGYPVAAVDLRSNANSGKFGTEFRDAGLLGNAAAAFRRRGGRLSVAENEQSASGHADPDAYGDGASLPLPELRRPDAGALEGNSRGRLRQLRRGGRYRRPEPQIALESLGNRDEKYLPRLPLGSKGTLEGKPVEVIGFLVKQSKVDGIAYDWREYLLAADGAQDRGTYRWLTEYNGHWNIADVLSKPPAGGGAVELADVRWSDQSFKHFASTPAAEVIQVAGEFTWRVRRGETNRVVDYVAPPLMLSRESTANDLTWSQGLYVEPAVLAEAFKLSGKLPTPIGVFANQPNPWGDSHQRICKLFWKLALLAIVLQLFFVFIASGKQLLRQDLNFSPQMAEETLVTREFEIRDKPRKITVRNTASLDNNWIGLDMTLVNKATGAAWPAARELAYYYGRDGGESWSEGSRDDEMVFLNIPPGTYYLAVDPEMAPEKPVPVHDTIEVFTGGAGWSNFIMVMLFLVIFPVFTRLRFAAFEARRWAESDHAPESSDDSDGDD